MAQYFLGVDPGLSGALAFYDPNTNDLIIHDMPTHQITRNGKIKRQLDLYQLGILIDSMANVTHSAIVEQVGALPGQGVTSMFSFGFSAGAAQAAIAAHLIPMTLVTPANWKRVMGLKTASKDASRLRASQLLPKHAHQWSRIKDDGRAEASLLAIYGAKLK